MYDVIENMIAFEDVDPNRVYILGFSAVEMAYIVPARMADRFAAANMSAGHANIDFYNLSNILLMQMGAETGYERNKDIARNYIKFQNLKLATLALNSMLYIQTKLTMAGLTIYLQSVLRQL